MFINGIEMVFTYLIFILALIFLIGSADLLVRSAVIIANYYRVSKLVVGMFVVGFGTSLPELVASLQAAKLNLTSIVLGNIMGSNIVNVLAIFGLTALIYPVICDQKYAKRDGIVLLLATFLFVGIGFYWEVITFIWALIFCICFIAYILFVLKTHPREEIESEVGNIGKKYSKNHVILHMLGIVFFLFLLSISADVMVQKAVVIANHFGVSEAVIGLTIIAIGTSLPELATCVVAAIRKHSEIGFGNIMGSNIYNILCISGVAGLVRPLKFEDLQISLWALLGTMILFVWIAIMRGKFSRGVGGFFLLLYGLYLYVIINY